MMIGGWLGFGAQPIDTPMPKPVPVVEQMTEQSESEINNQANQPDQGGPVSNSDLAAESDTQPDDVVVEEVDEISPVESSDVSASMSGTAKPIVPAVDEVTTTTDIRTVLVAGGCFWCVEADLEKTPGVIAAVSGYAGGTTDNPTYKNYGSGGHREVVEVTYDANQVSYEDLLIVTLKTTDPTDDDGTFGDRGDKYSSAFYYETPEQKQIIDDLIAEVDQFGPYDAPLAIDVEERPQFWEAEDSHQDYYKGTLTKLKYKLYRDGSGRTDFIKKHWGEDTSPNLPWRKQTTMNTEQATYPWTDYVKPDQATLEATMDPTAFRVTQKDGTERAGTSELDKIYESGIYVDVLSGEPLYSSRESTTEK